MIALSAIAFLHLESSPTPAGSEVARRSSNKSAFVMALAKPATSAMVTQTDASNADLSPEERSHATLREKMRLIEKGLAFLDKTPDYTAQFIKQELVNGDLLDEQEMEMKVRHAPFSIYLKWITGESGREVLYVDGKNDGLMTAHGGGWKARIPAISLEPDSRLAMAESRYPITKAGLYHLGRMMLEIHQEDLQKKNIARCEKLADQTFDDRPCHALTASY